MALVLFANITCRLVKPLKGVKLIGTSCWKISYFSTFQNSKMKGLVLGVYTESSEICNEVTSVTTACQDVDKKCGGFLLNLLKETGPFYKSSKCRLLWTPASELKAVGFNCVSVVNLGSKEPKDKPLECCDQKSENVRCAIADAVKTLRHSSNFEDIYLDCCGDPQSVAEAAALSVFTYDELKKKSPPRSSKFHLYKCSSVKNEDISLFENGLLAAESQNFARLLMEKPANILTPTAYATIVSEKFKDLPVKIEIRDEEWIKSMNMGSFLSVTKGSDEKPVFLEMHYNGAGSDEKSIALVGKGVTFDSGGISLKPSADMDKMRADMGGAACVTASLFAASSLGLKLNIKVFIPLCENLPSSKATKPGDVVYAMNGKSIQVDNTDAEGRLILADALCYAQKFEPRAIVDVATLTGAIMVALGSATSGVYSNDEHLWELLQKASYETGDRVWRMPLFSHYSKQITDCHLADINNLGSRYGGSCIAAAFLKEFISGDMKWMHIDMASVMESKSELPYLSKGMSGRPTRTIIKFLELLANKSA